MEYDISENALLFFIILYTFYLVPLYHSLAVIDLSNSYKKPIEFL